MLLVDVSGSLEFGTVKQMKKDMVTEIAATLAFSAIQIMINWSHFLFGSDRKIYPS